MYKRASSHPKWILKNTAVAWYTEHTSSKTSSFEAFNYLKKKINKISINFFSKLIFIMKDWLELAEICLQLCTGSHFPALHTYITLYAYYIYIAILYNIRRCLGNWNIYMFYPSIFLYSHTKKWVKENFCMFRRFSYYI